MQLAQFIALDIDCADLKRSKGAHGLLNGHA